jgi:hypothetical protein
MKQEKDPFTVPILQRYAGKKDRPEPKADTQYRYNKWEHTRKLVVQDADADRTAQSKYGEGTREQRWV